jgi:hypothetical protein
MAGACEALFVAVPVPDAPDVPPPPPPHPARRTAIDDETSSELNFMEYEWAIEICPKTPGKNARTCGVDLWVGFLARSRSYCSTTGATGDAGNLEQRIS